MDAGSASGAASTWEPRVNGVPAAIQRDIRRGIASKLGVPPGVGCAYWPGTATMVAQDGIPLDVAMEDGANGAVHAPPNGGACGLRHPNTSLELWVALEDQGTVQDEQVGLDRSNKLGVGRGGKRWSPSKAAMLWLSW